MTRNGKRQPQSAPARAFPPPQAFKPVVFKGIGGHIVTGPESQQVYCFSSHDPEQMIDARDAEALLNTGLFRIAH